MGSLLVSRIAIADVDAALRRHLLGIVRRYYRDPEKGLEEELRFGDRIYCVGEPGATPGAFLIVNHDHHGALVEGRPHRFSYLGLGCANTCSLAPAFQRAKADLAACIESGTVGILHLTTRTPYAVRGLEKAFGQGIYPESVPVQAPEAQGVAAYLKSSVHRHAERVAGESPFVLRELKQGRFCDEELERIRRFSGATPVTSFGVTSDGMDELIVFHRFVA